MRGSPSASVALGWNEYAWPAATFVAGVPLMRGATAACADTETHASAAMASLPQTHLITFTRFSLPPSVNVSVLPNSPPNPGPTFTVASVLWQELHAKAL